MLGRYDFSDISVSGIIATLTPYKNTILAILDRYSDFIQIITIVLLIACYFISIIPIQKIIKVRKLRFKWLAFVPVIGFLYILIYTPKRPYMIMGLEVENRLIATIAISIFSIFSLIVPKFISKFTLMPVILLVVIYTFVIVLNARLLSDLYSYFDGNGHAVVAILSLLCPFITIMYLSLCYNNVPSEIFTDYGNYEQGTYADTGITEEELPINLSKYKHNMRELDYKQHRDSDYNSDSFKLVEYPDDYDEEDEEINNESTIKNDTIDLDCNKNVELKSSAVETKNSTNSNSYNPFNF